jgi:hypothetical protein
MDDLPFNHFTKSLKETPHHCLLSLYYNLFCGPPLSSDANLKVELVWLGWYEFDLGGIPRNESLFWLPKKKKKEYICIYSFLVFCYLYLVAVLAFINEKLDCL